MRRLDVCISAARALWSRLESLPVLVMGTALTKTCATFGLTFFLATLAGPPQRDPAPVALKTGLNPGEESEHRRGGSDLLRMLKGPARAASE